MSAVDLSRPVMMVISENYISIIMIDVLVFRHITFVKCLVLRGQIIGDKYSELYINSGNARNTQLQLIAIINCVAMMQTPHLTQTQ